MPSFIITVDGAMKKACFVACVFLMPGVVLFPQDGAACAIPVFRYALECWEPYPYEAIVFHKEPLNAAARKAVDALDNAYVNLDPGLPI